jgi:hypothetical protein
MLFFNESPNPRRTHWVYDDPSGVPEDPLTVSLPAPLRRPVELAAADAGVSPAEWLARIVRSSLRPTTIRAI